MQVFKTKVVFLFPANHIARIGLLFKHKNSDFAASLVFVTERRLAEQISAVESYILDSCLYYTTGTKSFSAWCEIGLYVLSIVIAHFGKE